MDINDKDFFSLESEQFADTQVYSVGEISFEELGFDEDMVSLLELEDGLDGIAATENYLAQVNAGNESIDFNIRYQNTIVAISEKSDNGEFSYEAFIADAVSKSEVLEDDEVSTEGFKAVVTKIWQAIVIAFKKLGMAIANFIRTIQTKIGEMGNGSSAKYYDANKDKVKDMLKSDAKFKGILPKGNIDFTKIMDSVCVAGDSLLLAFNDYADKLEGIDSILEDKTFDRANSKKKRITKLLDKVAKNANKTVDEEANLKTSIASKKPGALPNATLVVREFVWGVSKPKAAEISVKDYLKKVNFDILAKESATAMKTVVNTSKKAAKSTNKTMKASMKLSKVAIKAINGAEDKSGESIDSQAAINEAAKHMNTVKQGYGYAISLILNAYKEFFRARGYARSAAKAALKKSK